jgi:hypothetical protein
MLTMHAETSTMISLRTSVRSLLGLAFSGLALTACDRSASPTQPLSRRGAASFDRKQTPPTPISARVLTNKADVSVIEVRTGTFNDSTNAGVPDGVLSNVEYTVTDNSDGKKGKKILHRKVKFERTLPAVFSEVVDLCQSDAEESWDDDHHDQKPHVPCPLQAGKSYSISVQAHVERAAANHGDDDEQVVTDTAAFFFNPDLDLSVAKIQMVVPGVNPLPDLGQVQKGTSQAYDVTFNNLGPGVRKVGNRATCEVHVFNGTTDVTPAGLTYRWIPDGRLPYNATKIGSAVSDTTTILPGDNAVCEFTMTLPAVGSFRIEVTAASVYPGDYDLTNNKISGTVTVIAGQPTIIPPDNGGVGVNATANDIEYFSLNAAGDDIGAFLGNSSQSAQIDSLVADVIDGHGITGTFTLKLHLFTVDGTPTSPTATRDLAKATWTGSLPDLIAATGAAADHCVSSSALGVVTVDYAKNGNRLNAKLCMTPKDPVTFVTAVNLGWGPPTPDPRPPLSVADGATNFGDYVIWESDLSFSNLATNPVSFAPVKMNTTTTFPAPAGSAFGAAALVRRWR